MIKFLEPHYKGGGGKFSNVFEVVVVGSIVAIKVYWP